MQLDIDTVRKLAHLARLSFEPEAEKAILEDLNKIIHWVEKLQEVDTQTIEPLTHMSEEVNVLREDAVAPPLPRDAGLFNAPKKDSDYFRVPKFREA